MHNREFDSFAQDNMEEKPLGLMADPMMSRRSFFSLTAAVGALTFMGSVLSPHGTMVSAWADEDEKIHFSLYILARDEMPILCFDVTDVDNKKPIENMSVLIASNSSDKTLEAKTNVEGFTTVRIKSLSLQVDDDAAPSYDFWGSVTAAKDGYRSLNFPKIYLSAGVPADEDTGEFVNTLELPTHPVADGELYLRTAALDSADVQYCDADCTVGESNTSEHTFDVEVIAPANLKVNAKVVLVAPDGTQTVWGEGALKSSKADPTSYVASYKGTWLKDATAGSMLKVKFNKEGGKTYVMSSKVSFVPAAEGVEGCMGDSKISPGVDVSKSIPTCPIPKFLVDIGDTFNAALPIFPIKIFSDNKSNFGFALTLLDFTLLKNRNGENKLEDGNTFANVFDGSGSTKAWSAFNAGRQQSIDSLLAAKNAMGADHKSLGIAPYTNKLDASFQVQLMGYFKWVADKEKNGYYWTGDVALAFVLSITSSWSQQYMLGFVPFYAVLDFAANVTTKFALGMKFGGELSSPEYGHKLGAAPMAIIIVVHLELGVAIGVGVSGIAGAGARLSGYLHLEYIIDEATNGKPPFHVTASLGAKFELYVEFLFAKKTWKKWDSAPKPIFDSWEDASTASLAAASEPDMPPTYLPGFWDDATVVTDDELSFAASFIGHTTPVSTDEASLASVGEGEANSAPTYKVEYTPLDKSGLLGAQLADANTEPSLGFVDPYDASGNTVYNLTRGLKPTYVKKLLPNGYSNSRLKVVHGYSGYVNKALLRQPIIAAHLVTADIEHEGVMYSVTRVAMAKWNNTTHSFGEEQILDFKVTNVNPWERYDVDFDFDVIPVSLIGLPGSESTIGFFAITSIVNPPKGDVEACEIEQFVTIVRYNFNTDDWIAFSLQGLGDNVKDNITGEITRYRAASYQPRLLIQAPMASRTWLPDLNVLAYTYYYRTTAVSPYWTSLSVTAIAPSDDSWTPVYDIDVITENDLPDDLSYDDFRHGKFEVYSPDRKNSNLSEDGTYWSNILIGWTGRNSSLEAPEGTTEEGETGAPYSFVMPCRIIETKEGDEWKASVEQGRPLKLPYVSSLKKRVADDDSRFPFVYTDDTSKALKKPYMLVYYEGENLFVGAIEVKGATRLNRYFASADGKWLYTVRSVKHTIPGLSDNAKSYVDQGANVYSDIYKNDANYGDLGDVDMNKGGKLESYQLMEARWHESLDDDGQSSYYHFYPIAQLDINPDRINVINHANGRRDFLFTNITAVDKENTEVHYDLDEDYEMDSVYHVCDTYQVAVPHALGLHVKDLQTVSQFATVEEKAYLTITLHNTGNWFITGFEVDFYGPNDELIETGVFTDLEKRVRKTKDNVKQVLDNNGNKCYDDNGNLMAEEEENRFDELGMLAPGYTRTYLIEFTVPKGLSGDSDFSLRVKNPRCEASEIRKDYVSESDYQVDKTFAFVDPKLHGVPSSEDKPKEHHWAFTSNGAPYAIDGEDPQPDPPATLRGDVNNDGKVDDEDVELAYGIAANKLDARKREDYEECKARADVNGDGAVDAADAFAIKYHNAKNIWADESSDE